MTFHQAIEFMNLQGRTEFLAADHPEPFLHRRSIFRSGPSFDQDFGFKDNLPYVSPRSGEVQLAIQVLLYP